MSSPNNSPDPFSLPVRAGWTPKQRAANPPTRANWEINPEDVDLGKGVVTFRYVVRGAWPENMGFKYDYFRASTDDRRVVSIADLADLAAKETDFGRHGISKSQMESAITMAENMRQAPPVNPVVQVIQGGKQPEPIAA